MSKELVHAKGFCGWHVINAPVSAATIVTSWGGWPRREVSYRTESAGTKTSLRGLSQGEAVSPRSLLERKRP